VPVLNRSDEVSHPADLVETEAAWTMTSAARSVVELTVLLTVDSRVVATACESDDVHGCLQGHDGRSLLDCSKERFLLRPIALTLMVEGSTGDSFPGEEQSHYLSKNPRLLFKTGHLDAQSYLVIQKAHDSPP
jgi:hypothetical protein